MSSQYSAYRVRRIAGFTNAPKGLSKGLCRGRSPLQFAEPIGFARPTAWRDQLSLAHWRRQSPDRYTLFLEYPHSPESESRPGLRPRLLRPLPEPRTSGEDVSVRHGRSNTLASTTCSTSLWIQASLVSPEILLLNHGVLRLDRLISTCLRPYQGQWSVRIKLLFARDGSYSFRF